jgi:hypothetical protein
MTVERRDANVLFVAFNERAPAESCAECPFRRCCTCAHWLAEARTCLLGARPDAPAPTTDADDWCGRWEPRSLRVVVGQD